MFLRSARVFTSLADIERRFLTGDSEFFSSLPIPEQVRLVLDNKASPLVSGGRGSAGRTGHDRTWSDLLPVDMEPREREQYEKGRQKTIPGSFKVKVRFPEVGAKLLPFVSLQWLHGMATTADLVAVLQAVAEIDRKFIYRANSLRKTVSKIFVTKISDLPDEELEAHVLGILVGLKNLEIPEVFMENKIFPIALRRLEFLEGEDRAGLVLAILQSKGRIPEISYFDFDVEQISDHMKCDLIEAAVTRGIRDPKLFARLEINFEKFPIQTLTCLLQAKMHFALVGKDDAAIARNLWTKVSGVPSLQTVNVLMAFADEEMLRDPKFQGIIGKLKKKLPDLDHARLGLIGSVLDM